MSDMEKAVSCTPHCGKRRFLGVIFVMGLIGVYIASEWGLRHTVYGQPQVESSTDWKPIVGKLPLLLREPIERRLKADELERRIQNEKKEAPKLKMLYELAPLYSGQKRKETLQRIVTQFRHSPETAMAWSLLITEFEIARPVEKYLAYLEDLKTKKVEQKVSAWVIGWGAIQRARAAGRDQYLLAMADAEIVSSSLVEAYEELENMAIRQEDTALQAKATKLLEPCRELRLAELEGMMEP